MSLALSRPLLPRCSDMRVAKLSSSARIGRANRNRISKKSVTSTVDRCCLPSALSEAPSVVTIDLGERSYPIYIGSGLLDDGDLIRKHVPGRTALVVTNETIAPLYLDRTVAALESKGDLRVEVIILPDGEKYKTVDVLMKIFDKALESKLDRQTTFVALGGGVIGDMTGFAAASYQRGVHFVQVPTTVMSMVDSSVGGKTGVNHPGGKNMIGAFYQPRCVVVDIDTLDTLPDREFSSGLAEVVKYGLIRDREFFEWQEANVEKLMARKAGTLVHAIEKSCINKAEVVALDEREGGVRATLNLGHTFGHAIETGVGYGEWLHGEAVSVGIVMAAFMSERLGWIDQSIFKRTTSLLEKYRLPVQVPSLMTKQLFMNFMAIDKKSENGQVRFILLRGELGCCVFTGDFDQSKLEETLDSYVKAD